MTFIHLIRKMTPDAHEISASPTIPTVPYHIEKHTFQMYAGRFCYPTAFDFGKTPTTLPISIHHASTPQRTSYATDPQPAHLPAATSPEQKTSRDHCHNKIITNGCHFARQPVNRASSTKNRSKPSTICISNTIPGPFNDMTSNVAAGTTLAQIARVNTARPAA